VDDQRRTGACLLTRSVRSRGSRRGRRALAVCEAAASGKAIGVIASPAWGTRAIGSPVVAATVVAFLLAVGQGVSSTGAEHGRLLIVRGDGFLKSTLFSVCVDTGKLTRLTPGMYGDWSPDGRTLVVGRVVHAGRPLRTALFLVSSAGRELRRLTTSPLAAYWPTWTVDARIVFTREERPNSGYLFYTAGGLWSIAASGGPEQRLANSLPPGSVAFLPAGGPRGQIVFSVIHPPIRHEASKPGADLYLLDRSGKVWPLVTDEASDSVGPAAWSADGQRIAFFRRGRGIFVLDLRTKQVTQLTNGSTDAFPGWSPSGERIAFTRESNVYTMSADGTDVRLVVREAFSSGRWVRGGC
jgi:dipeptidyl aminopeptidase/acylaminoacyl peptidase